MNSHKIKVLFLVGNLRPANGVTSFAMSYFRNIDHNKIEIDFALLNDVKTPYYNEILNAGSKIFILPPIKKLKNHIARCRQILQENDYQIVHDNLVISSLPMMYCAYKLKIPVRILQSHNTKLSSIWWKAKRNQLFLPFLKKICNVYFACGTKAGKAMFDNSNFKVIPNAISFKKSYFSNYVRSKIRQKYNCKNKIIIGTVGRLSLQKNPFFAIKVIENLLKNDSNIQYWWIGSGELSDQVQKYIEDNHLSDYVKLFGSCDNVSDLYQAMDVFFLPSLFEGLPITAIEAQAAGLPCVISNTVTKELVYTDLVDFISLKSPLSVWNNRIIEQSQRGEDRSHYLSELKKSPFYSLNAANLLSKYYLELINNSFRSKL